MTSWSLGWGLGVVAVSEYTRMNSTTSSRLSSLLRRGQPGACVSTRAICSRSQPPTGVQSLLCLVLFATACLLLSPPFAVTFLRTFAPRSLFSALPLSCLPPCPESSVIGGLHRNSAVGRFLTSSTIRSQDQPKYQHKDHPTLPAEDAMFHSGPPTESPDAKSQAVTTASGAHTNGVSPNVPCASHG